MPALSKVPKESKDTPLVSVIIPCYNYGDFLTASLESVFLQEYPALEVIVVDDGSTDSTAEVAAQFPAVKYLCQKNQGVSAARNRGLTCANGDYVQLLDADDELMPAKIAMQAAYLQRHPEVDIVFSTYENFYDDSEVALSKRAQTECLFQAPWYLNSSLIRRALFGTIGLFDESLKTGEDTEWIVRLRKQGVDLSHKIEEVLYRRRLHGDNLSLTSAPAGKQATMQHLLKILRKSTDNAT